MTNPFDQLSAAEGDELNGFLSKLNRKRKKIHKKARKLRKKIYRKTKKGLKKVAKSKVFKVAAVAAAAYFGGPLILGKAGFIKGLAGKAISSAGAKKLAGAALQHQIQKKQAKLQNRAQAAQIQNASAAVGMSPEFQGVYNQLKAQGYSDEQIAQYWAQSEQYANIAVPQVAKTIYPQVRQEYINAGYSRQAASEAAYVESVDIAEKEVKKVQSSFDLKTALMIGAPLLTVLLTNR